MVVGYNHYYYYVNVNWKTIFILNLDRRNKRTFHEIPYKKFIDMFYERVDNCVGAVVGTCVGQVVLVLV